MGKNGLGPGRTCVAVGSKFVHVICEVPSLLDCVQYQLLVIHVSLP